MTEICLALDTPEFNQAQEWVYKTRSSIGMIKIGPEFWANEGVRAFELGQMFNIPIFLDLKLHDIPNTVKKTIDIIQKRADYYMGSEIAFLSIHAFGGRAMMEAAVEATKGTRTKVAAVTLLTSLNKEDMWDLNLKGVPGNRTTLLAELAKECGVEAFITSPMHTSLLRDRLDVDNFKSIMITPGIRSSTAPEDDQKRTKPVSAAVKDGSDWLVVGRPITQSLDPTAAAASMLAQIKKVQP